MSFRWIDYVLEHSTHSGSERLLLVVLANYADDTGRSYPSVGALARKCNILPRSVNYALAAVQASGELQVMQNHGPRGTNVYQLVQRPAEQQPLNAASPLKGAAPLQQSSPLQSASPLKPVSDTPEAGFSEPLKPASAEPSLNLQEPSDTSLARPPRIPNCPFELIVAKYHEALPELPRVIVQDAKGRRNAMKSFWAWVLTSKKTDGSRRAADAEAALAWVGSYFERASSNDWLMGRTPRAGVHANWRADLDYLMTERGRQQVIEKTSTGNT